jgi:hypothetical protein
MISGWFMDVPYGELNQKDLDKFVAWMLFSKYPHEVRRRPPTYLSLFVTDWSPAKSGVTEPGTTTYPGAPATLLTLTLAALCQVEAGEEAEDAEWAKRALLTRAGMELPVDGPEHFCMRHTLDPMRTKHKPMIIYLVTHCFLNSVYSSLLMRALGFRRYKAGRSTETNLWSLSWAS